MNLGKPRRRLTVAERPSIDLDAYFGTDAPAESVEPSERDTAQVESRERHEAVTDAVTDSGIDH